MGSHDRSTPQQKRAQQKLKQKLEQNRQLATAASQLEAASHGGQPQQPAETGQFDENRFIELCDDPTHHRAEERATKPTFQQQVASAVAAKSKLEDSQPYEFTFPNGITQRLRFELNAGQSRALEELSEWLSDPNERLFNLRGYAGTGKTTIMKLFVRYATRLRSRQLAERVGNGADFFSNGGGDIILAAPTHRARTVLYNLAGADIDRANCLTIHSLLALRPDFDVDELDLKKLKFATAEGKQSKMPARGLVILDECSMVSDKLADVLEKKAHDLNCKICYVGDPAQLKPVRQDTISRTFQTRRGAELRQVMRQKNGNPISFLLEGIRNNQLQVADSYQRFSRISATGDGIIFIGSSQMAKSWAMEKILSEEFAEDAMYMRVLCGTNQRCAAFNQSLRKVRFGDNADEYVVGDLLSGYANYGKDENEYDLSSTLITNSADYIVVGAVLKRKKLFVEDENKEKLAVSVQGWQLVLVDADQPEIPMESRRTKTVFILSRDVAQETMHTLSEHLLRLQARARAAQGQLKKMAWNKFFYFQESFCTATDYKEGPYTRIKRTLGYGYAMTVHKSQGGTYEYVLVDEGDIDSAFPQDHQLRHQLKYVAFSRASKQVLCLTNQEIVEPSFDF